MTLKLDIKNSNLHHAYCILGNGEDVVNELEKFFQKELKFSVQNNPDFWYGEYDTMDIEDGRALNIMHQNRPTAGNKKIFVVSANFVTEKAQNAMLKIFEEPRGDTHFFLVLPGINGIIPTLRSRMIIIDNIGKGSSLIDVKDFIKSPLGKRMEAVRNLCESISDEEQSKIEVTKFINALEVELKKHIDFMKVREDELKIFEEIEKVRVYAGEQSPSLKMLLEHIAILLPVLKD